MKSLLNSNHCISCDVHKKQEGQPNGKQQEKEPSNYEKGKVAAERKWNLTVTDVGFWGMRQKQISEAVTEQPAAQPHSILI